MGPDGNSFDTITIIQGGKVKIQASSLHFCDEEYIFDLPPIPSLSDIPMIADLQQSGNTGVTVSIDLPTSEWKVLWFPSVLASCDTCMTTKITVDQDTTIQVLMSHISGCVFEQTFRVTRTPHVSLEIPNIFNPTSTSGNEKWSWTAPDGYKIMQCLIYDRWGNQSIPIHNFRDHIVEWHIQWKLSDWRGLCLFHQVDRSIRENSDIERGCDTGEVGIFYILSS